MKNEAKIPTDKYRNSNGNQYPSNLDIYDISAIYCLSKSLNNHNPQFKPRLGWKNDYAYYHTNDDSIAACIDNVHLIRNDFYGHLNVYSIAQNDFDELISKLKFLTEKLLGRTTDPIIDDINRIEKNLIIKQETLIEYHDEMIKLIIDQMKSFESIESIRDKVQALINKNETDLVSHYQHLQALMNDLRQKVLDDDEIKNVLERVFSDGSSVFQTLFTKMEINILNRITSEMPILFRNELAVTNTKVDEISNNMDEISYKVDEISNKVDDLNNKIDMKPKGNFRFFNKNCFHSKVRMLHLRLFLKFDF